MSLAPCRAVGYTLSIEEQRVAERIVGPLVTDIPPLPYTSRARLWKGMAQSLYPTRLLQMLADGIGTLSHAL